LLIVQCALFQILLIQISENRKMIDGLSRRESQSFNL
jgi:hypothetical protein